MTSCPHKMNLEAEHSPQFITRQPEAPDAPNKEKNRSLKKRNEMTQNTSDETEKGINIPKEKMNVGRNDDEEFAPNENKLPGDDDKAAEGAIDETYTEPGDKPTTRHDKRMNVTQIEL